MADRHSEWQPVEREGWGFNQDKAALYLFERKSIYVFKVGEGPFSPVCLRKRRGEGWAFCRGDDLLDFPYMRAKSEEYAAQLHSAMTISEPDDPSNTWRYDQFEQFFAHLDADALQSTLNIGVHSGCWPLYCTLTRVRAAADLLHTPALLVALSQASRFIERKVHKQLRRIRRIAKKPARGVLVELGFPGTRSSLRTLRKLTASCMRPQQLLRLRAEMNTRGRTSKWLNHLDRINEPALFLLTHPVYRGRYDWSLLEEASQISERDDAELLLTLHLLRDTLRMLGDLPIPRLRTLSDLFDFHGRLTDEAASQEAQFIQFPDPPIEGIPGTIEPITNTHALLVEGRNQQNCLAAAESWAEEICDGTYYIYRVLSPERASLGIRRSRSHWVVDQLYGAKNRPFTSGIQEIHRWLEAQHDAPKLSRRTMARAEPIDVNAAQLRLGL